MTTNPFIMAIGVPTSPASAHAVSNPAAKKEPPAHRQRQGPSAEKKTKRKNKPQPQTSSNAGGNPFNLGKSETPPPITSETNGTAAAPPKSAAAVAAPPAKKAKRAKVEKQHPAINNHLPPSFRNLQLPITAFSCMPNADAADADQPSTPQNDHPPPLPLPTATPAHLKWKDACVATREHPNYSNDFNYKKAQQLELDKGISTPSDWITTRPYGEWCKSNPAAIAIDCEMCASKDPVTGNMNPKALCRISVVNADNPEEVLLDTLVKPEWPVCDYRTWVNGIRASDLKDVQFTMKHAQQFMAALCSDQTLVVGHAVHNDLLTLRMIHHCNVDTAMLFSHDDENLGTVSLKNLALAVMKRDMPDVHDSVNDARVALLCADHYVANDGQVDPVEKVHRKVYRRGSSRRPRSRKIETDDSDTPMLLVHRLPIGTLGEHLSEMFLAYACIRPNKVHDIRFSGTHGKCRVEFLTREHAELAYMSLPGEAKEDSSGTKQKRVGLNGGGYVCVRKMKETRGRNWGNEVTNQTNEVRFFVGNLSYDATEASVRTTFEKYGLVIDCTMMKGCAFVTMPEKEAEEACSKVNGMKLGGRELRVSVAHPKEGTG